MKKGVEILPEENYKLRNEDTFEPSTNPTGSFGVKGHGGTSTVSTSNGDSDDSLDMGSDEFELRKDSRGASQTLYAKAGDVKVGLADFNIKKVIGRGSFGKVFLVQKKGGQDVYAMKSLRKDVILDYDQVESTKLEKEILLQADHPFLVGMNYVFQTESKIFFVMRFVRGGELFMHLRNSTRFTEERAKFYSAQVALAIGHLHNKHIIYRDLKPENILMDQDGYICLTDFGLAKIL